MVVTGACRRGGGGRAGGSVGVVLMVVVRDHRRQRSSLRPGSPRQTAGRQAGEQAGAAPEPTQTGQQVSNSGPDRWDT